METVRILVSTQDDKGRWNTEHCRHIPADEVPARREAIRQRMPRGSVYKVKVVSED